jgi:hypothetical protein
MLAVTFTGLLPPSASALLNSQISDSKLAVFSGEKEGVRFAIMGDYTITVYQFEPTTRIVYIDKKEVMKQSNTNAHALRPCGSLPLLTWPMCHPSLRPSGSTRSHSSCQKKEHFGAHTRKQTGRNGKRKVVSDVLHNA